jgi:hypothetical protein
MVIVPDVKKSRPKMNQVLPCSGQWALSRDFIVSEYSLGRRFHLQHCIVVFTIVHGRRQAKTCCQFNLFTAVNGFVVYLAGSMPNQDPLGTSIGRDHSLPLSLSNV